MDNKDGILWERKQVRVWVRRKSISTDFRGRWRFLGLSRI